MKILMHVCLTTLLIAAIWGLADAIVAMSHYLNFRQPYLIAFCYAFIIFGLLMLGIFWGVMYG